MVTEKVPDIDSGTDDEQRVRYCVRFNDIDAALMHAHDRLHSKLIDPDSHLYRATEEQAIAAIESIDLRHEEIYIDAELSADSRDEIDRRLEKIARNRAIWNRFFQFMGYIGIGLLILNMLISSKP